MAKNYGKSAQKWQSAVQGAGQSFIDGINAVDVNPMQLAVQHQDALIARFTEAIRNGSWAGALNAVTPQQWKEQTTRIGATNYTNGAAKGASKISNYFAKAGPMYQQIRNEIRAMPNATDADRQARMMRNYQLMKQMKGITHR